MNGDNIREVKENFFEECFSELCSAVPQWSLDLFDAPLSVRNIFWASQSEEWRKNVLIIRKQTTGMCFLTAVFVFEHYMMASCTNKGIKSTYDVGKYEAATLKGEVLEKFLLQAKLNSTTSVLTSLCRLQDEDLSPMTLSPDPELRDQNVIVSEYILRHVANRPAILAQVKAADMANSTERVVFTDPPPNQPDEIRHAMVLIGARRDENGEYFFLVQNWWESRYFMELSGRYLAACDAKIIFLRKNIILERKEVFNGLLNDAVFAETCADASECCSD
jgi:hypothetical protein